MRFAAVLAASALWLVAAIPVSAADTLTPSPVTVSLVAGTSIDINKTLTLDGLPARADIIVAIDTTASMGAPIAQAQADATNICTTVKASIPGARFAAVDFEDYPGMPAGAAGDTPYVLLTPGFVSDCTAFSTAIGRGPTAAATRRTAGSSSGLLRRGLQRPRRLGTLTLATSSRGPGDARLARPGSARAR
jgi:hypothetical protein